MPAVLPGKLIETHERVFLVNECHYDEDGDLAAITAKCLTPRDGDTSEWFTLEVYDENLIEAHTLQ